MHANLDAHRICTFARLRPSSYRCNCRIVFIVEIAMMSESHGTFLFKPASRSDLFDNWPSGWPRKENHVIQHDVTLAQYQRFAELVHNSASERKIEEYFGRNREVLSLAVWMFATGHHMSWIFPKEQIRPSFGSVGGLIPDYLVAGADSGGVHWFVLEPKGVDKRAFTKIGKRVSLSADANKGVCQLLNYIDLSSRDQTYLRDGLELTGFREPQGMLLIGTEDETHDLQVRNFKSAWNRLNSKVQIRSYSGLLGLVEKKLRDFHKFRKTHKCDYHESDLASAAVAGSPVTRRPERRS
jgi:hypothetical protein